MNNYIRIFIMCLVFVSAKAQTDYTRTLDGIDWVKIESKADIIIETHDKNEILIEAGESCAIPERAKGLKLVGAGGTDNTDVGFYVIEDGNNLLVKNLRDDKEAKVYLPANQNVNVQATWNGDLELNGFTGEVEVEARLNGSIYVEDISGPLTANSLNGEIEVIFATVNQTSPISIFTTNGAVDVTLPPNTKADLTMGSWNGDVYTDFDIERPKKRGMQSVGGSKVKSTINNGGVAISLKSTNGNIYLRKK